MKNESDQAAVDAMRRELNKLPIDGTVVIGEGEMDEAPMLWISLAARHSRPHRRSSHQSQRRTAALERRQKPGRTRRSLTARTRVTQKDPQPRADAYDKDVIETFT